MSDSVDSRCFPAAAGDFSAPGQLTSAPADPTHPLTNLSAVSSRMESLQRFLSDSISRNILLGGHQMEMVSSEISSAIQQVIANGAALLTLSQIPNSLPPNPNFQLLIPLKFPQSVPASNDSITVERKSEPLDEELDEADNKIDLDPDYEVIELDSVELLAEHVHFCEVCGKGFKRDANLRMHMRAHGEQFKRPEALAKPPTPAEDNANLAGAVGGRKHTRFSCPFAGCNRNQHHKKFRPLKSVICVRNHFKRSHCPKMYSCNRCNKKNFSVLADLKSHLKHCGQSKWRCTCGTTFSRKDKLFGHMALFEGHRPAIGGDEDDKGSKSSSAAFMAEDEMLASAGGSGGGVDDGFFDDGLFGDQFPGMDEKSIQEMFGSSNSPDFVQQFYANM